MSAVLTSDNDIRDLLLSTKRIAVVGLSGDSSRPSFGVASYLRDAGYEIIPVNPNLTSWQGIPAFPSLQAIGRPVDLVDIFRRPELILETIEDAIAASARAIWTQLGVVNHKATDKAVAAGLPTVIDRCTLIEHRRLIADREAL